MKEKFIKNGCFAAFLLMCLGVAAFLHIFTEGADNLQFVQWNSAVLVNAEGKEQPQDLQKLFQTGSPGQQPGEFWRFTTTLQNIKENDCLVFELYGAEISITLDEKEIFTGIPENPGFDSTQVQIPLSPENNGQTLTMTYLPVFEGNSVFPPAPRLFNFISQSASDIAYAGYYNIPASVFAVITIVLWGLFLLSIASHKPDYSLLLLLCASTILTVRDIVIALGHYFSVHEKFIHMLASPFFAFLPVIMLLTYMLLNRQKIFRRLFAIAALGSSCAILIACLISFLHGGKFFHHVLEIAKELFLYGSYPAALYWITGWIVVLCAAISALLITHNIIKMKAEAQSLAQKNKLVVESYHAMEQGIIQTNALRHEMKNQLIALDMMYRQENIKELGDLLKELTKRQENLAQLTFTDNFVINTIFQNYAYRCQEKKIHFKTEVSVPKLARLHRRFMLPAHKSS